ncbi:hypothetical protein RISK_005110 [Rhodopirellula islandica]|uniref:Uncharacterized protein n=1 Tax=Rhodopirellula islandica TaxID=595434 RepID=A0A0J1EB48_RHOIS|nr:hypothetical protein RISK_005110 [Rhodopirellula islandica]
MRVWFDVVEQRDANGGCRLGFAPDGAGVGSWGVPRSRVGL